MAKQKSGSPRKITLEVLLKSKTVDEFIDNYLKCTLPRGPRHFATHRWCLTHEVNARDLKNKMNQHPIRKQKMIEYREHLIKLAGHKTRGRWDDSMRYSFVQLVHQDNTTIEIAQRMGVSYYSCLYNRRKYTLSKEICDTIGSKPTVTRLTSLMSFSATYLVKCIDYGTKKNLYYADVLYRDLPFVKRKKA